MGAAQLSLGLDRLHSAWALPEPHSAPTAALNNSTQAKHSQSIKKTAPMSIWRRWHLSSNSVWPLKTRSSVTSLSRTTSGPFYFVNCTVKRFHHSQAGIQGILLKRSTGEPDQAIWWSVKRQNPVLNSLPDSNRNWEPLGFPLYFLSLSLAVSSFREKGGFGGKSCCLLYSSEPFPQ